MIVVSSSVVWPTQVRWAIGSIVVSRAIRRVIPTVRSRVPPPAPYVTETNVGCSGSSSRIERQSTASPSASAGGKNSNENERWPVRRSWPMAGWSGMPASLGSAPRRVRAAVQVMVGRRVGPAPGT